MSNQISKENLDGNIISYPIEPGHDTNTIEITKEEIIKRNKIIKYLYYGKGECVTYSESIPIHNVFLINTFVETEPIVLELENLFKKFDLNVHGVIKKKDATRYNLMNSVEEFKEIIQNNEPTLLVYFGQGWCSHFDGGVYLVTSDNYIIHMNEIIREFNFPKLCVSPILFIKYLYNNLDKPNLKYIDLAAKDWNQSCLKNILDGDDNSRDVLTLEHLCLKSIYNEKARLLTICEQQLPPSIINLIKEYIKIKNWGCRKMRTKCIDVENCSIEDMLTSSKALTDIAKDKPLSISVLSEKLQNNILQIHFEHKELFTMRSRYIQ